MPLLMLLRVFSLCFCPFVALVVVVGGGGVVFMEAYHIIILNVTFHFMSGTMKKIYIMSNNNI